MLGRLRSEVSGRCAGKKRGLVEEAGCLGIRGTGHGASSAGVNRYGLL